MNYERGYNPYDKGDVVPDWLRNGPQHEAAAAWVFTAGNAIREIERASARRFSQLASDGYDPYNKAEPGRRYVYRIFRTHDETVYEPVLDSHAAVHGMVEDYRKTRPDLYPTRKP